MSTREALTALIHHVLISRAHQVSMGLPIREAAVEEVWAWPGRNEHGLNRSFTTPEINFGVSDINSPINCWSNSVPSKIMRLIRMVTTREKLYFQDQHLI